MNERKIEIYYYCYSASWMKKFSLQQTSALSLLWKQPILWIHFINNKTTLKQNKKAIILAGLITGNPWLLGILKCCVRFPTLFFSFLLLPHVCVCACEHMCAWLPLNKCLDYIYMCSTFLCPLDSILQPDIG